MRVDEIESYMISKGWKYNMGTKSSIQFVYNPAGSYSYAEAYLQIHYVNFTGMQLYMQYANPAKHSEYSNSIKVYKAKLIDSGIDELGTFYKKYRGATTTFTLSSSKGQNSRGGENPVWFITLYSND